MARPAEDAKTALIKRLARRARARDRGARQRDAGVFVGQFYANVPSEDLLAADEAALLASALSVWKLMRTRPRGKARIRVFSPIGEQDGWAAPCTMIEIVTDDMPFLVSSVTGVLNRRDQSARLVIHPVVSVRRDRRGRLIELYAARAAEANAESVMLIQISPLGEDAIGALQKAARGGFG